MPRLLVLTDRSLLPAGRSMLETLLAAVDAGLEAVVLRGRDVRLAGVLARRARVITARELHPSAEAVHLAAHQPPVPDRHGRSCHTPEEVAAAVTQGAAYVTVSPVAVTPSKPGYGPPLGAAGVRAAVAVAREVPVFALGGVTPENAAAMRAAGAHGVAVMGAVMSAVDPGVVVRRLLEVVS